MPKEEGIKLDWNYLTMGWNHFTYFYGFTVNALKLEVPVLDSVITKISSFDLQFKALTCAVRPWISQISWWYTSLCFGQECWI